MEEYLPYSRVCRGITVLRDPSAYKPDDSSLNDEVTVQGRSLNNTMERNFINALCTRILCFISCYLYPRRQIYIVPQTVSTPANCAVYCLLLYNILQTGRWSLFNDLSVKTKIFAKRSGFLPLTLANAFTSSGETNSRYWFAKVMRTRSAHGYRLTEKHTGGWRLQAHPYLKLPLLIVLILGVDPLLRVRHPTFKVLRIEWHETSNEKCNSSLHKILRKG